MTPLAVSLDEPSAYQQMESVIRRFRDLKLETWHKAQSGEGRVCFCGSLKKVAPLQIASLQVPFVGPRTPLNSKTAVSKISEHFRFALEVLHRQSGYHRGVGWVFRFEDLGSFVFAALVSVWAGWFSVLKWLKRRQGGRKLQDLLSLSMKL